MTAEHRVSALKDEGSTYSTNLTVAGYQKMVEHRISDGWHGWLLTLQWIPAQDHQTLTVDFIQSRLERFYALTVSRFIRHPKRYATHALPLMLAMPDRPVPKQKPAKATALLNDAVHAHAIYLVPPATRDLSGGTAVFGAFTKLFIRRCGLMTFHHVRCVATPSKAVAYVLKSYERGRYDDSTIWVFPRTRNEMNRNQRHAGGGSAR